MKRALPLTLATFVLGAAVLSTAGAVEAQQRRPGQERGMRALPMFRHLDLTDHQREQIRALFIEQREQRAGTRAGEERDLHKQLNAEIFSDVPNTARIDELTGALAAARAEALASRIDQQLRLAQILTPEQRQELLERADRQERRGPWRQRRGGERRRPSGGR